MSDLLAARSQMAISLAFHIVFASIGIGLPLLMILAEVAWLRTGAPLYRRLNDAWARGLALFFAVGAVSGTVLSFELGLLWPTFMEYAGPLIGMPFSLEGLAFFAEAIFLGIYLYGWGRVSPRIHLASGVVVALSGAASGLFVLSVNGWMNAPVGFEAGPDGPLGIDPVAAMANPFWIANAVHALLAAYVATGFGAATLHAWRLLRRPGDRFHQAGLRLAVGLGAVAALLQPISGDFSARVVGEQQPIKLAAMEAHFETRACAPLLLGGLPDAETRTTRWALAVPCGLSLLHGHSPDAVVQGLEDFPEELWPPLLPVRLGFQIMIGVGVFLAGLGLVALWRLARRRALDARPLLFLFVAAGPLAFLAIQAGWVVTEVGRQPWVIYGVMKTADAVTPMPGLVVPFVAFTLLYVLLSVVLVLVMGRITRTEERRAQVESGS
ncbi:MAG: cytochrome ubiquinol oxidase subunit I [Gemmatimonadota bacterium]|nr:cytochrome ubiquinol oxidase subunit I [Gemmatimonadota bacterium]